MKNFLFVLSVLLLVACHSGKKIPANSGFSTYNFSAQNLDTTLEKSSTYGRYFFPQGDLRALVIYVDFEEEYLDPEIHDDLKYWPLGKDFPQYNKQSIIQEDQSLVWGYENPSDFANFDPSSQENLNNLSAFFYQMSAGKFRFCFETLKHPNTQKAISVKINPKDIPSSPQGRNELNQRIFEKIREIYPKNHDWSRFDSRKNNPNYQSISASDFAAEEEYADHQLDFVIMLFRNSPHWNPHPNGSTSGVGWRKAIMGTSANEVIGYHDETPIKVANQGIRVFNTHQNLHEELEIILHEIAHAMLSIPHYNRANKAEGDYFFYPYGWGMMDSYTKTMSLANAWERWYAGWTEITHNLNPTNTKDTLVVVQDYLSKHESLRVQLPHLEDEFLWIEYRKDSLPFYGRPRFNTDRYGNQINQQRYGVFAFTEKVASSRQQTFSTNTKGTNGLKTLYGKGNFDFEVDDYYVRHYAWNNKVMNLIKNEENPYGGQNEGMYFRADFNANEKIDQKTGANGAGSRYIDGKNVYEIEQKMVLGQTLPNAAIQLNKISAFTNPPITNFQPMDWQRNQLSPVVLHSLSLEFSKDMANNLQIWVNYKDGVIENDFRMTGPLILPSGEEIILQENTQLILNKSKTINRVQAIEGDFIENSKLTVKKNGKLRLDNHSIFRVEEHSEVLLEAKSIFEMKADSCIELDNTANFDWEEGVKFEIHPSALVVINNERIRAHIFFELKSKN